MTQLPNETTKVELPFIRQLEGLGWTWLEGNIYVPYLTERQGFREVLLTGRLRKAIQEINLDEDGQPWLDDARVNQAVSALERLESPQLLEANQQATRLLTQGTSVSGDPNHFGGRDQRVQYIDFIHPERNDFLVINQYHVDPPWMVGSTGYIVPDIVLFVNGIPLGVVECKDTDITNPMWAAINDLLSYSNQRGSSRPEGAERLFHYNLLMIGTWFYEAKVGAIGMRHSDFKKWRDTSPIPLAQVAAELSVSKLEGQQILVAGMLRPAHLIDILRHFTLFEMEAGKLTKVIPRYQQYRAVHLALHRLGTGQTRQQHGETDQRGGIIWHNQGSGKSKTMVFLIRAMRSNEKLRRFKVVVVTDRRDLVQNQAAFSVTARCDS